MRHTALGIVLIFLPAMDGEFSPRRVAAQIKTLAANGEYPVFLYAPGWPHNEDVIYYLTSEPALPEVETVDALEELASRLGAVTIVTDRPFLEGLSRQTGMAITIQREFKQPRKKNLLLVSVSPPPAN